jgi:transposase-like protein
LRVPAKEHVKGSHALSTTAGDLELRIPKLRSGSFFPSLLERRRRIDQALFAVIMEAYLHGVSTRKVDDLVKALGADTGISKSEVSRICKDLDQEVGAFRDRSLADTTYPYVFLDATYCKARVNHRVVSQAIVVAIGVTADGRREVLGMDVGESEDGAFWTAFLRGLKARGLGGVQLVISDAHSGLKQAIAAVLIGSAWQRCRVHFMRNVLAVVPKGNAEMVAAAIRTIFAQPDAEHVEEQFDVIAGMLGRQLAKVEAMLRDAKDDLLAFTLVVMPAERFLSFLTDSGRSPNTVKAYAHDLRDWFAFLAGRELDWAAVTVEDVAAFVAWLRLPPSARGSGVAVLPLGEHCSASTVNRKLAAVGSMYQHAGRPGSRYMPC